MMNRLFFSILVCGVLFLSTATYAATFSIVPLRKLPTSVHQGSTVTAQYTITNKTSNIKANIEIRNLPNNIVQDNSDNYCGSPSLDLNSKTCTLQLIISGAVKSPQNVLICFAGSRNNAGCTGGNLGLSVTVEPPVSPPSLIAQSITSQLKKSNFDASVWSVNTLDSKDLNDIQILQVPGADPRKHPAAEYMNQYKKALLSANASIDIASLWPKEGPLFNVIHDSLVSLSYSAPKSPIIVRIILGDYIFFEPSPIRFIELQTILQKLTQGMNPNSKMKIYVGIYRMDLISWNHAKVLVVDNKDLIMGGINFIDENYSDVLNPSNDLSLGFHSDSLSASANKFLDKMWDLIYKNAPENNFSRSFKYVVWEAGKIDSSKNISLLDKKQSLQIHNRNSITSYLKSTFDFAAHHEITKASQGYAISIGRLGAAASWQHDAADVAILALMNEAHSYIKISQQMITNSLISGFFNFSKQVIPVLCKKMSEGVSVQLLQSGSNSGGYSSFMTPKQVEELFARECKQDYSTVKNGRLFEVRTNSNKSDPNYPQEKVRHHGKVIMVDGSDGGKLVYVGSQNLYDGAHAEYGILIDSSTFSDRFEKEFWNYNWGK